MNYCPLEESFERDFINGTIFSDKDLDGMKSLNYIHSGLSDQKVHIGQLIFTQTLSKHPHEYEKLQPVVSAALKMNTLTRTVQPGDKIRYIIKREEGTISERAYPYYQVDLVDVDINFYMDRLYNRREIILKAKDDYPFYLKTIHWQKLRYQALRRADNKCQLCSNTEDLEVHHNTYENKWREPLEDLVVLCHDHHELYHHWEVNDGTQTNSDQRIIGSCRV